ncbi:hypothetical protein AHiyo6_06790 [Arthrobacter sp. Hiyo6]|nr:hypothetical protein AHiyo6_06790 [Arthrobacter sp. Hiyo6]
MTIDGDTAKLLAFIDSHGIDASAEVSRGWASIGAIIVDAPCNDGRITRRQ